MIRIAALIGMVSLSAITHADTFTATASFEQGLPLYLETNVSHTAEVNFSRSFESIDKICFTAYFEGDLADPDESFMLGPFGNSSFGWINVGASPLSSRTVCTVSYQTEIKEFMDGVQAFGVRMSQGQATLTSLEVVITGVASSVPTHQVDITLDDEAMFVPAEGGRVPYDAILSNLSYEFGYLDFMKWSVLTLPTGEDYPIHKVKDIQLSAGEELSITTPWLKIPAWFPAGEYKLTWYMANPLNENQPIVKDSLTFVKLAQ